LLIKKAVIDNEYFCNPRIMKAITDFHWFTLLGSILLVIVVPEAVVLIAARPAKAIDLFSLMR